MPDPADGTAPNEAAPADRDEVDTRATRPEDGGERWLYPCGNTISVTGTFLKPGDRAPDFSLTTRI
jgi:hypothetical protein